MPQQTNLNVSPYFDDFSASNDYHKILFKPGLPVQARELTGLQSILQNQIERFGQHFFKEGSKVIPGNTGYNQLYYCVQLRNSFQGVPVAAYATQLIGTKISGETSGVSAVVDSVLLPQDSERGALTLYISYLSSNTANNESQTFLDNENLTCSEIINSTLLGNSTIPANSPFAVTRPDNAAATGSSFQIQQGVYFIRGYFVNVTSETLLLDQYSNTPSYRVGLQIEENLITSQLDESLNDNSQGFNNYAAPGADRLQISVSLFKKALDDFDDNNFIELASIDTGVLRSQVKNSAAGAGNLYQNELNDILARRTFDESGNYTVNPFDVSVVEALDNNLGNNGLFQQDDFTYGGQIPTDDLGIYKISTGKSYVKGYEIETTSPTFIDFDKPRTTKDVDDESLTYNTGSTLKVNRVYGVPSIGIGNTYVLSLRDKRIGSNQDSAPGTEIGVARVYDFRLQSGTYNATNSNINEWGLSLYDVQPYSFITLNQNHTLTVPTYIKGANSGATAFLQSAVTNDDIITVYGKNGSFIINEPLMFNGVLNGRTAIGVTEKSLSDVKSIFGTLDGVTGINTFNADIIQSNIFNVGVATVSSAGKIQSSNPRFLDNVKVGNLVKYSDLVQSADPILLEVLNVQSDHINVIGVHTVSGVVDGGQPASGVVSISDMNIVGTTLESSSDNTLYTKLTKPNVATINLNDSKITIRKAFTVNITTNGDIDSGTSISAGQNELFLPFTPERYILIRTDGVTETLTPDKFAFNNASTEISNITGLTNSLNEGATLIATLEKTAPKSKKKIKSRVESIIVAKSKLEGSGIGTTTLNNGLDYGNFPFGTRVEDEIISLNTPDIIEIHGIYESSNMLDPSAPTLTFSTITSDTSTTSDTLLGELLIGQTSGAIAICVEKPSSLTVAYISKNQVDFVAGETIIFQESLVEAVISAVDASSFEISSNFTFSSGQKKTIYDYGSIRRRDGSVSPSKRLKIYFAKGYFDTTDTGDLTTVESYNDFDYGAEIQSVDGISNSDILDIRPRVGNYAVSEGARSPLEFNGRTFNASGNSAANPLASQESTVLDFSYYQGRIDRIYLTKDGKFQVVYGTAADKPEPPAAVDDAIEIATITLPAYLYNTEQASLKFLENKRYRMSDIKQLENRIRNLEYYTALSLLEQKTESMYISDADGLNRFKSGFFVDNFNSFKSQETKTTIKNSIDRKNKELRPKHHTDSIDMIFGPVVGVDATTDFQFNIIEGENVSRQADILTLDYSELEWLKQNFATRSESVTPFSVSFWQGTMELTPASDTWVDTVRVQSRIVETEGNYAATVDYYERTQELDHQSGFVPILWDSWETNWTGILDTIESDNRSSTDKSAEPTRRGDNESGPGQFIRRNAVTVTQEEFQETFDLGTESRGGTRTIVHEEYEKTAVGDRIVSRDLVSFMRPRNIEFYGKNMKPNTQLYPYFDGISVSRYCVSKLIEITMNTGTFQPGENVRTVPLKKGVTVPEFRARLANINHKEGAYNDPTKTYISNPYDGNLIPGDYDAVSTFLNIDTYSLSNEVQPQYYGYVEVGSVLVGETSGATATVSNLRIVSDEVSDVLGSFYIPDTVTSYHPRFEAGDRVFSLSSDATNDSENVTTIAEERYLSSGIISTDDSIRSTRISDKKEFGERTVNSSPGTQVVGTHVLNRTSQDNIIGWYEPLAQSFLVDDSTGIFLTRCDIYFRSRDNLNVPVTLSIRPMESGKPSARILPLSEVVLDPTEVVTSIDGSEATSFIFRAPIYLKGETEYAVCISSNSTSYSVYVSRIGQEDILDGSLVSNQPYLGNLYKSTNASTWEASQWEDLKFNLYRAEFDDAGTVEVYNPQLSVGNQQVPKLLPNSLEMNSRVLRIGFNTAISDAGFALGNEFFQSETLASGTIVAVGASAQGTLTLTSVGAGFTPSSGQLTFDNVNLVTISGRGNGAKANVTINNGVAIGATVVDGQGGIGYAVGDVLGITTIGNAEVGRNLKLTVAGIGSTSSIILDSVQGEFVVGSAKTMTYINSAGLTTTFNFSKGGDVQISSVKVLNDGEHIKVNHQNHGMYFDDNRVEITGAESDLPATKLLTAYEVGSTASISVNDNSNFANFEGQPVGTTNAGYLKIGNEVIEYTETSGSNLIGGTITRGSNKATYPAGTLVYKYELNGINLSRINKIHDMNDVTVSNPITYDSYHIKLDTSEVFSQGVGVNNDVRSDDTTFSRLFAKTTKSAGGYNIRSTQNVPFEVITPMVQIQNTQGTTVNAQVRTTTTKGLSGNEIPFVNAGFEDVQLNKPNYLSTPRAVFSKVNENLKLINTPGSKSLSMRMSLNTVDSRVSPIIDTQRINCILTSNRVDQQITNYATDSRVNGIDTDPTAFQYMSREISLENPATSIKIILNAYLNTFNDIRAFYSVEEEPSSSPVFIPFPGHDNLNARGEVISAESNNGKPDAQIQKTNFLSVESKNLEYKEYTFTMDKLSPFKFYRIKLVLTSTSQVYCPRVKDLRVIALA